MNNPGGRGWVHNTGRELKTSHLTAGGLARITKIGHKLPTTDILPRTQTISMALSDPEDEASM